VRLAAISAIGSVLLPNIAAKADAISSRPAQRGQFLADEIKKFIGINDLKSIPSAATSWHAS
jgi:hypothetical protein